MVAIGTGNVSRLRKSIDGLNHVARRWSETLPAILPQYGLITFQTNPGVYVNHQLGQV